LVLYSVQIIEIKKSSLRNVQKLLLNKMTKKKLG